MNYILEINSFYRYLLENPLNSIEQALWFRLMAYCNTFAWKNEFTMTNTRLMEDLQITRQQLDRARITLIEKGLIAYKKGSLAKCGDYKMISFCGEIDTEIDDTMVDDTANDTANDTVVIQQSDSECAFTDTVVIQQTNSECAFTDTVVIQQTNSECAFTDTVGILPMIPLDKLNQTKIKLNKNKINKNTQNETYPTGADVNARVCDNISADNISADKISADIIALYNKTCTNLNPATELSNAARERAIRRLWLLYSDIAMYKTVFSKANKSDFLCGKSSSGWKACLDWLIKPDKFVAVFEGNYDNQNKNASFMRLEPPACDYVIREGENVW